MPEVTQSSRLLYLMLFRVGLVTILLVVLFVTELALSESAVDAVTGSQRVLLISVVCAYGLTLLYALLMRHVQDLHLFTAVQVGVDLLGVSLLVYYTGGTDSTFGFAYLLAIVGASTVLRQRGALVVAGCALLLYAVVSLLGGPGGDELIRARPTLHLVRPLLINGVAMAATALLATRLAAELQRASERIDSQRTSLQNLATLHREVIQSLQSGLISVDLAGRIATMNSAAAEILGTTPERAYGQPVEALLHGVAEYLTSADMGAIAARLELRIRVPGGHESADRVERILGVTVSRLVNHRGELIGRLINFQDLTDLRRAEETAKQADRLAVIGRMAATVAHEIRNPLAAICGSVELLSQMMPSDGSQEASDLMQIVAREGKRLDGLITELLSYASPRPLDRARIELGEGITQTVQLFANDRRLGQTQLRVLRADRAPVDADPGRLRQVIWNVLRNAAEACPEGPIEVSVIEDGESRQVQVLIRDHGHGIPQESKPHLFEPFFTTKESGTGLGLATVHRIVEEHGGHVELRNAEPGPGALCVITLPLSVEPETPNPDTTSGSARRARS
jgi:two-component system sensor histidine kinase PilS (NtrC family)